MTKSFYAWFNSIINNMPEDQAAQLLHSRPLLEVAYSAGQNSIVRVVYEAINEETKKEERPVAASSTALPLDIATPLNYPLNK